MELKSNQAAFILEASGDGEISVDVRSPDIGGFRGRLCVSIAKK